MIDIEKVRRELNDLDIDIKDAFGHNATNYDSRIIVDALDELKRLQKKETPMKPIKNKCPNCSSDWIRELSGAKFNRCLTCGQVIDWDTWGNRFKKADEK